MTTAAYDGRAIAIDSQITAGSRRMLHRKAYTLPDGTYMVASGRLDEFQQFLRWYEAGQERDDFPKLTDMEVFVVHGDGRVILWDHNGAEMDVTGKLSAIGSGGDYALGAMHMGANAAEAVRVAAVYDIYTSGEVEVFDTSTIQPVRRRSTKKR